MLSETQGKQGDAIGVSLFPCRAAAPKKSASDGGVHRDSLAVYLDPVDADTAAGLYLWACDPEAASPDSWDLVSRFAGAGILVAPGDFYGAAGRGRVRIALTATDERIEAAASRLEAAGDAFLKD